LLAAAASLVLRFLAQAPRQTGDRLYYLELANNIASGKGLVVGSPHLIPHLWAMFPPFYPLLLAATGSVLTTNYLIDLAGAAAIIWLGKNRSAFVAAAAIYLLLPDNILLGRVAHKEGLAAALCVGCAASAIRNRPISFGIFSALIALTQPALVTFAAMMAICFIPPISWLWASVPALLIMLPWWIRNWLLFGEFIPLTSASGLNLWVAVFGNGREWTPYSSHLIKGDELTISKAAGAEAMQAILAHPIAYVAKCLTKTLGALMRLPFFALIVTAPFGRSEYLKLVVLCLVQLFVFQMWFELGDRHRFFMVPFLLVLAASAVEGLAVRAPRITPPDLASELAEDGDSSSEGRINGEDGSPRNERP
jgi:hypothetical protein